MTFTSNQMDLPFRLPERCIGFDRLDVRRYTLFYKELTDHRHDLLIDLEWQLRDATGKDWHLYGEER
jgi:hypothetical protein